MIDAYREAAEVPCTCDELVPNPCVSCWLGVRPCRRPGAHLCKRHGLVSCNGCGRLVPAVRNVASGDGVCKHSDKDGPQTLWSGAKASEWSNRTWAELSRKQDLPRLRWVVLACVAWVAASMVGWEECDLVLRWVRSR